MAVGLRDLPRAVLGGIQVQTSDLADSIITTAKIATDAITTAKMEDSLPQWVQVSLTNAEMLALRATPKQIIAAPGAGKIIELLSATLFFDYTAAYTESADNMAFKYENGSGAQVSNTIEATGFVDATADTQISVLQNTGALIVAKTGAENKAVVLHNTGDGEYGGGNAANVIRVNACYRILTTGW